MAPCAGLRQTDLMTVSRLRVAKSETRDLAERDRLVLRRRLGEPSEWLESNSWFFAGIVGVLGVLTVLALALH